MVCALNCNHDVSPNEAMFKNSVTMDMRLKRILEMNDEDGARMTKGFQIIVLRLSLKVMAI